MLVFEDMQGVETRRAGIMREAEVPREFSVNIKKYF